MPPHDHLTEEAPARGVRVRQPRESDVLSTPLRCAFDPSSRDIDDFTDLLAEIDRVSAMN